MIKRTNYTFVWLIESKLWQIWLFWTQLKEQTWYSYKWLNFHTFASTKPVDKGKTVIIQTIISSTLLNFSWKQSKTQFFCCFVSLTYLTNNLKTAKSYKCLPLHQSCQKTPKTTIYAHCQVLITLCNNVN